jgi:hypothetical protein
MIIFKPSSEQGYYNKNKYIKSNERIFDSGNKFRLSYYVNDNKIYCYYMGRYYLGTMYGEIEEIDLINSILTQCNDPYKVNEIEEIVDVD